MYNTCKTTAYRRSLLNVERKSTLVDSQENQTHKEFMHSFKKAVF